METNVLAWLEKTADRLPEKVAYLPKQLSKASLKLNVGRAAPSGLTSFAP